MGEMLESPAMASVMVIGAGGQVAGDLIPALSVGGHTLTLVDRLPVAELSNRHVLSRYFRDTPEWQSWWRVLDVADPSATRRLISEIRPEVTYHLAALLSAKCETDPAACWRVNMTAFTNVLEALRELAVDGHRPKLIWPSSIAAFGPARTGGRYEVSEDQPDDPLWPKTMYGVTKVACEVLGSYYAEVHGVDFRSIRFPGLLNNTPPGGGSSDYANQMYFDAVNGSSKVCFVSADARIPFMYMEDAVRALVELAAADEARLTRRVYNVRAFGAPSAREIAASIAKEVPGFTVRYEPDRRQEFVDSWPDDIGDQDAESDWGWKARVADLDTMTRRLLEDFREIHPR